MKTELIVEVKRKHIDRGNPGESNTCAIAEALRDQFHLTDEDEVSVDESEITINKSNGFSFNFTWNKIPKIAQTFIKKFDATKDGLFYEENEEEIIEERKAKLKPFSFKLPFIKF